MTALPLLASVVLLAACAHNPTVIASPTLVYQTPPADLVYHGDPITDPTDAQLQGANGSKLAAQNYLDYKTDSQQCRATSAQLQKWINSHANQ